MFKIGDRVFTNWQGMIIKGFIIECKSNTFYLVSLVNGHTCLRYASDLL